MRVTLAIGALVAGGLLAAAACSGVTEACTADLQVAVSPQDTVIHVGQQFPIHFTLLGCGGTQTLSDSVTYMSASPATATVDPSAGVVAGVAVGTTTVTATAHHYNVSETVSVKVE